MTVGSSVQSVSTLHMAPPPAISSWPAPPWYGEGRQEWSSRALRARRQQKHHRRHEDGEERHPVPVIADSAQPGRPVAAVASTERANGDADAQEDAEYQMIN